MKKSIKKVISLIKDSINYIAFYLCGNYKKNKQTLCELKGRYAGKRCFVICNGPSLRADDLTKIHDYGDISIGINLIGRIYNQTQWRPNILVATDGIVFHTKNIF